MENSTELLIPEECHWFLTLTQISCEIGLALFLIIYIPYLAVAFMTMYLLKFFRTKRQKVLGIIPIFWGSKYLAFNYAEFGAVFTFLGIHDISQHIISAVKENL